MYFMTNKKNSSIIRKVFVFDYIFLILDESEVLYEVNLSTYEEISRTNLYRDRSSGADGHIGTLAAQITAKSIGNDHER